MRKYELLQSGESIIRVLEIQDKILIIDCIKQSMPVWVEPSALGSFSPCPDTVLMEVTGVVLSDVDALDADQRKVMYDRYTMIAPVLPFIADDRMRSQVICSIAKEQGISKQTVRYYLCLYLSYMDISDLAPRRNQEDRTLTKDNASEPWPVDYYTYKERHLVECFFQKIKWFRRIFTRYDKLDDSFLEFVLISSIVVFDLAQSLSIF